MQAYKNYLEIIKKYVSGKIDTAASINKTQALIILLFLFLFVAGLLFNHFNSKPGKIIVEKQDAGKKEVKITVHVDGEVLNPGLYKVPGESRVHDAIMLAGGETPNADLKEINLARIIEDGEKIYIPVKNQGVSGSVVQPTSTESDLININTADAGKLDGLPGIGPAYAERIIEYRTENGPFSSIDDLDNVKGIGPAVIEKLRDQVTF